MDSEYWDVIVVGAGNAAFSAAAAARESGASVIMLEAAPESEAGGNTRFTAGAMRVAYDGPDDIAKLVPDLSDHELATTDFGTYSEDDFFFDMARVTRNRADSDLLDALVSESFQTLVWMTSKGVRFVPIYGRQAFKVDGKFKFWGGLTVETVGGGPGLVDAWTRHAKSSGVRLLYGARVQGLAQAGRRVVGVEASIDGEIRSIRGRTVVLACGGFEANAEWRTRYLGPGWDLAKVRGTRFNAGDGIRIALDIGASPSGHWSGCHAVAWELNAPEFGDLAIGDQYQKHSYPFGVVVNAAGRRFLDEGADFRNYTYAKYGAEILKQPGHFAWQVFDAKSRPLLRDEYRIRQTTKVSASSLAELASKLEGVDGDAFVEEINEFNAAVDLRVEFNASVKDARRTRGLAIDKSNWANPIDAPPFEAYAVTCGVTFTFGGLRINDRTEVLDIGHTPIPGLFAAGEIVGGLFYFNYPGGTGLTSGAVFGRRAGRNAAALARA